MIYDSILTTLDLYGPMNISKIIEIESHHGHSVDHVIDGIHALILNRDIQMVDGSLFVCSYRKMEEIPESYLRAADEYRQSMVKKPSLFWRVLVRLCGRKFAPMVALVIIVTGFCAGLCAQEMPPWVLPGIMKIETASYYGKNGIIYVDKRRGKAGEVGPTQALPATLRDFKLSPSLVEQDPKYAEAATILILSHYYSVSGSWDQAVGAWRKGLGKRNSQTALSYIQRVKDAGE